MSLFVSAPLPIHCLHYPDYTSNHQPESGKSLAPPGVLYYANIAVSRIVDIVDKGS